MPKYLNFTKLKYGRNGMWKDRNDTSSMYWDGEYDGSGWLTKKSDQGGCGACWVFAPIAVFECITNLFFNQHLDFDLSEQHLFSCSDDISCEPPGGYMSTAIDYALENGVKTEYCFPYYIDTLAHEYRCGDTCINSDTLVFAEERIIIDNENDSIKEALINFGPLACGIPNLKHKITLIGYRTDWEDTVTIWIFKDSRSKYHYLEFKHLENLINEVYAVSTPVTIHDTINNYSKLCFDKDNDGFYWWGIGPKPDTCPTCPDQRDSNDNDPFFGPYDSCYNETCNYQYNSQAIHITSDTTWDSAMIVQNTVYVDSGYSLTIRSELKFVEHSGIIVKQGGKLNIYGGSLTKACHELWRGIEIWGHYDTTQIIEGIQGVIRLDSNALIEYAEIGITAGCRDIDPGEMYPYLRAGGIIIAKNSAFLNNTIDIEFQPYQNIHPYDPKLELSNISFVHNCLFETNNNDNHYYPPDKHVFLNEVKGIVFKGCSFRGTHLDSLNAKADRYKGYGIYSIGSSFTVENYCSQAYVNYCPDSSLINCSFENLQYGIYTLDWNTSHLVEIDSAEFSNNICGIFLSGLSNTAVNHNTFNIIPKLAFANDTICGLYLEGCTGYQVEESIFLSDYEYDPLGINRKNVGLYIKNTGTANNEIYNNKFDSLNYATIVEGVNRGDTTGLCLKCNDYRYNMNDIFVVPDTSIRNLRLEQGIAEYQGTVSDTATTGPAGNTFTEYDETLLPDTVNIRYYNYLNDTTEYFNYLHHSYEIFEPRVFPQNVNDSTELIIFHYMNLDYEKEQSCPSSFNQGGGIGSLQSMIALEEYQIEALETDIGSTVDGGNTSNLLNEIQNSNPSQGNTLRQQLISYSPYLSDTVVALSIEKENVLPNPFLRDIMLANPHSVKKEKLVSKIDSRNTQMPAYMKQEINNAKYNLDALDLLLSEKRTRENKKDKLLNSLIRLYLCDTNIQNPFDSIKVLLENEQTFNRKIELAYLALQQNDSTEARNIINNIEDCFSLSSLEDSILFYYDKFIEILIHQKSNQKADVCIDSLATLDLLQMYHKKLPTISNYAGNLLQAAGKLNKKERYYFPINPNTKSTKNTFLPFD